MTGTKVQSAAYIQDGDVGLRDRATESRAIPTRRDRVYRTRGRTAGVDDVRLEKTLLYFVRGTMCDGQLSGFRG